MKKILAMLLSVAIASSSTLVALAAAPVDAATIDAAFSRTKVNIGDTFTVTFSNEEKSAYFQDTRLFYGEQTYDNAANAVTNGFEVKTTGSTTDNTAFEITAFQDGFGVDSSDTRNYFLCLQHTSGNFRLDHALTLNLKDEFMSLISTSLQSAPDTYKAANILTVTFKALKAGEYTFTLYEQSDNTNKTDDQGFNGIAKKEVVTVVDPNAAPETTPVTGVSLNKATTTLKVDATETLTATVAPSDATNTNVTWTSSDEDVATVANDGTVTAVGVGEATITVASEENSAITATCVVTVEAPDPVPGYVKGSFTKPLADLQNGLWTAKLTNNNLTEDNVKTQQLWFVGTPEFDYGEGNLTFTVYTNVKDVNTADITIEVVSTENN